MTERTSARIEKIQKVLRAKQTGLTVVLENVDDPHNVSAVLRSCEAVGILEICLVYLDESRFPQLQERSSATSRKWMNFRKFLSIEDCFSELRQEGKKIFTTHLNSESKSLFELELTQPVALVFGNEHDGISETALALADGNFLIPQVGMIQSLNISVACAVSLYEAFRQRNLAGMYETQQISSEKFDLVREEWLKL